MVGDYIMREFHVGDRVLINEGGCFRHDCGVYRAEVCSELDNKNCYRLRVLDSRIRDLDRTYGIDRECRCLEMYVTPDTEWNIAQVDDSIDISHLM